MQQWTPFILVLKDIVLHIHFHSFISQQSAFCLKITMAAFRLFLSLIQEETNLIMLIKPYSKSLVNLSKQDITLVGTLIFSRGSASGDGLETFRIFLDETLVVQEESYLQCGHRSKYRSSDQFTIQDISYFSDVNFKSTY